MPEQSYANHRRYVFLYHVVLFGMIVLTLIGSCVNLYKSVNDHQRLYSAALIVVMNVCLLLLFFFARVFALKAQDRAVRAEENVRHLALTGKLLDPRLDMRQIVGLRFAPDDEFADLARRAAESKMTEDEIKRAVRNWKADTYRA